MIELSVTYRGQHGTCPAILRKGNTPGTWAVWPENPADGPFSWVGSIRAGRALLSGITTERAAVLYPEHARAIQSLPDSSD